MKKAEFIEMMAKAKDCPFESKAATEKALNYVLNSIKDALSKGKVPRDLQFVGFGTFKVVRRKARKAINPQDPTGAKINIKAKNAVTFKPGKSFKDAV
jgi:nucleoid DNA-binding protein